jgi:carbon monoxide dehydrogenase subunit G
MGSVTNEIDIDRPADDVWKLVRDFGGIADWIPGIDACRVEGDDRIVSTMGMELTETLRSCDDDNRTLEYSITKNPMGVEHHEATIAVTPTGDSTSHVTYSVDVTPDSMADVMGGVYGTALKTMKSKLEA